MSEPEVVKPVSINEALEHADKLGNALDSHVTGLGLAMQGLRVNMKDRIKTIITHFNALNVSLEAQEQVLSSAANTAEQHAKAAALSLDNHIKMHKALRDLYEKQTNELHAIIGTDLSEATTVAG